MLREPAAAACICCNVEFACTGTLRLLWHPPNQAHCALVQLRKNKSWADGILEIKADKKSVLYDPVSVLAPWTAALLLTKLLTLMLPPLMAVAGTPWLVTTSYPDLVAGGQGSQQQRAAECVCGGAGQWLRAGYGQLGDGGQ